MRTSAAFTPSFFNAIPTDEAPGPSQPAHGEAAPLTYSSEKDGTVDSFVRSAVFGAFKQEYTDVLDHITAFVHDHAGQVDPPLMNETKHQVKADFDVLKTHLFDLRVNYFGLSTPLVYGTGKEMFHEFDSLLKKGDIPLQQRMNAVLGLAPRAKVCSGGLLSDLQETIARLKAPRCGLKGAAYQWKQKMLQALILEHVQANHEYTEAWEIHYVNAYYNGLAPEMGVSTLGDTYVKTISDEQLEKCRKHVFATLKPTRLATMLADEYRSRVEASFSENAMAADNLSFENIKTLQDLQESELDPEYGPVPVHAFVAPADPEDYGSPQVYTGAQRPIGVTRHFLKALKQQELVNYDKESKIVLDDTDEGRILMLDDLLWRKDKDGEPQELTLQSLLNIAPEVLFGNIEKAAPEDTQARAFLLRAIIQRVHESLEAAGDTGELLGKWLSSFAPAMEKRQLLAQKRTAPFILHAAASELLGNCLPSFTSEMEKHQPLAQKWTAPLILHAAVNHASALRDLLKAGGDKNATGEDGRTALMLAAQGGHTEATNVLIEEGADKNARDNDRQTALMLAAGNGKVEALKVLIAARADNEARGKSGRTALIYAADNGHADAVQALLGASANKEAGDNNGQTALIYAANNGHADVVQALLDAGADKEAGDNNGKTALMLAANNGHVDAVQTLLAPRAGANPETEDHSGWTALMRAAGNSYADVVQVFDAAQALLAPRAGANLETKDHSGWTALMLAADNGHASAVQVLLDAGANKEAKDYYNKKTALMLAADNGRVATLKVLLDAAPDMEARSDSGKTALIYAANNDHDDVVKVLLDKGADKDARDNDGQTALMLAAGNGKVETLKVLIAARADKEVRDTSERTALIYAAHKGHADAVQALLADGADKEAKDNRERTALIYAADNSHADAVQALLAVGAEMEARDWEGRTAMMCAARMGEVDIVKALIQHGANGVNELMMAAVSNNREMAAMLIQAGADGAAALLELARQGSRQRLKRLIEVGADKVKDDEGKTALMRAVEMAAPGNDKVLKALLAAGADTTIQDNEGKTAKEHADELVATSGNRAAYLAFIEAATRNSPGAWRLWR